MPCIAHPAHSVAASRVLIILSVPRFGPLVGQLQTDAKASLIGPWGSSALRPPIRRTQTTTSSAVAIPASMSHPELWPTLRIVATAVSGAPELIADTARHSVSPTRPAAAARSRQ